MKKCDFEKMALTNEQLCELRQFSAMSTPNIYICFAFAFDESVILNDLQFNSR